MKKALCNFVVVSLIFCSVSSALAWGKVFSAKTGADEWVEYVLAEPNLRVHLPENYTVLMRGVDPSDSVCDALGMTSSQIDQWLVDNNSYLDASSDGFRSEIVVMMMEGDLFDFATASDSTLLTLAGTMESEYRAYGIEILDKDVFSSNGVKYLRFHLIQTIADKSSAYKIQYYTTINGQAFNFLFIKYAEDVSETEKGFMQTVVEHVAFETGMKEYTLDAGPLTVTLDESKYNILVPGMQADDPAVIRSGIDVDQFETYMAVNDYNLLMFGINERIPAELEIKIRIKDGKYPGVDLRECSEADATMLLDYLYTTFANYEGLEDAISNKEIVVINDVPYLKFNWAYGSELRYVTFVNDDIIYFWASRKNGTISDADAVLLRQVVETAIFPK